MGTYNKFTEQEIEIIRNNYETMSKQELMTLLPNRNWEGILNYGRRVLHLSREHLRIPQIKIWTEEENQQLLESLKTLTITESAKVLNVSRSQVERQLIKLGLTTTKIKGNFWTEEEQQVLVNHFSDAPQEYVLRLLPNKNWQQISRYARAHYNLKRNTQDIMYCNYQLLDTWTEQSAYILGLVMSDGYVRLDRSQGNNVLCICLKRDDADIIYKIAALFEFCGKLNYIDTNDKRCAQIKLSISNRHVIEQAIAKGIPAIDKSHVATYPDNIPEDMHRHFIRGLIDGDGWITYNRQQQYVMPRIGLCGTYDIVQNTLVHFPVNCSDHKVIKNRSIYKFGISGQRALNICDWLYEDATIYMNRKYKAYKYAKEHWKNN